MMYGFLVISTLVGIIAQNVYGYTSIQILIGIFLMGGAAIGVVNAIVVDLFPTEIRAMALALSLMCGRLGAVTGSNVIGPLIYKACNFTFYATALDHLGKSLLHVSNRILLTCASFSSYRNRLPATVIATTSENGRNYLKYSKYC